MAKISPLYREDSAEDLDPEIKSYLDATYLAHLENLAQPNPKLLIVFAGGNAVGKSALARRIQLECRGLLLENDAIKRLLLERDQHIPAVELNVLTWKYTMDLYARINTVSPNGLVIRDGIIQWYYDRILPIFEANGYQLFIIRYDLTKPEMQRLVEMRGDTPTVSKQRLLGQIDDHLIHLDRFFAQYQADVVLTYETLFKNDFVLQEVKRKLAKLRG